MINTSSDRLYKFNVTSGIIVIGLCGYLITTQYSQFADFREKENVESVELASKSEQIQLIENNKRTEEQKIKLKEIEIKYNTNKQALEDREDMLWTVFLICLGAIIYCVYLVFTGSIKWKKAEKNEDEIENKELINLELDKLLKEKELVLKNEEILNVQFRNKILLQAIKSNKV